jgi:uncharacterized protein YggE
MQNMKTIAQLALSIVLVMDQVAVAGAQTLAMPPLISVTGEATISVLPDLAEIEGGVTSVAKTAREASEANNKAMAAVVAALKAAGIPDADIRTSRLSLQPQSTQDRNGGPMQITGYQASNNVTVRVRDMSRVAAMVDTLVSSGANSIGGINFMVASPSSLLDDARARAVADARRKAEIYAKAAGVQLGAPVSISEQGASAPIPLRRMSVSVAAVPPPVLPGQETLSITVSVSYEIKPAP